MKSLTQYIFEHLLTESTVPRYLIGTWEHEDNNEDQTLLSGSEFYDVSKKLQSDISKDDLEKIFNYAIDHSDNSEIKARPEPLVANYNNTKNNYAFRRWVIGAIKELDINFKGDYNNRFHDTNLKGNGEWSPTAQDTEEIIALAYNNINNLGNVTEEKIDKKELIIQYYQKNDEKFNKIAKAINIKNESPLRKLPNIKNSVTKEWLELGTYGNDKPDNTPKTDIISADGNLRISIKKSNGSQLMSGGYHEAKATILTAIKNSEINNEQAKELTEILNTKWLSGLRSVDGIKRIKQDPKHELYKQVNDAQEAVKKCESLLQELIQNDKFLYALLYEAMTGEVKYGEGSKSSANYVLVWDIEHPDKSKLYEPKEYVEHLVNKGVKCLINFKSANNKSWQNLRIITK